jgi:hypothetical protein
MDMLDVHLAETSDEAQLTVSCGGAPPSPPSAVTIVSDGTETHPHCSWDNTCNWDTASQQTCATALCNAAGYALGGTFVSASNNPCDVSFTDDTIWYFSIDGGDIAQSSPSAEAQVTARCSEDSPTAPPPPAGVQVMSDGTDKAPLLLELQPVHLARRSRRRAACASAILRHGVVSGGGVYGRSHLCLCLK